MQALISIKFLEKPFEDCSSSVEVTHVDPNGRQRERFMLGVVEVDTIYDSIHKSQPVNLKHRYVKDFSLSKYREKFALGADSLVAIVDFNATGAYLDTENETDFSHAHFVGATASFERCIFGNGPLNFYHSKFYSDVTTFSQSRFGAGIANFQYAEFGSREVSFDHAHFDVGDIQFVSATFGDSKVSFKEASFGQGEVDFHYSTFGNGNLSFDKATFGGGDVSFKRVDFGHGKVDFKRVDFGNGNIDFSESSFKSGKVVFRSAIFGEGDVIFDEVDSDSDFSFDNAEFGSGKLSFYQAVARKLSFRLCQFNNYVDLRVRRLGKLDLSHTIVRDIIDLMPTENSPVEMDEMNFSGMRNLGNLYIDWRENKVLKLIMSQDDSSNHQKSEQFLILKETYNSTGRYADEDKAYVWYKRLELKADLEHALKRDPKNAIWAYPTAFSKWLLFDKIGLYATEPVRVIFSIGVVYTLFSLLYLIMPLVADTYIDTGGGDLLVNLNPVAKAFYYSAITFLTIGYGEYYPVGIMRLFASVEGYVGVFLMGYFSVAFVRKVLR
ncbi:MAG: potassium channel family protein [Flavobacteriales bacterium]